MHSSQVLLISILLVPFAQADFFQNMFGQRGHHQSQQQQQQFDYQANQLKSQCNKYLCSETFSCVNSPVDCPCPFPDTQMKCILPDMKNYVCIAKVNPVDAREFNGEVRDCKWVEKAWKGLV